jgi:hypothetical protein
MHYKRVGKRFVAVRDDGEESPYLVWKPFRGWYADESSLGQPASGGNR